MLRVGRGRGGRGRNVGVAPYNPPVWFNDAQYADMAVVADLTNWRFAITTVTQANVAAATAGQLVTKREATFAEIFQANDGTRVIGIDGRSRYQVGPNLLPTALVNEIFKRTVSGYVLKGEWSEDTGTTHPLIENDSGCGIYTKTGSNDISHWNGTAEISVTAAPTSRGRIGVVLAFDGTGRILAVNGATATDATGGGARTSANIWNAGIPVLDFFGVLVNRPSNAAVAAMAAPVPAPAVVGPPADYVLRFEDQFNALSLRSGGPTEAGYIAGSGTWKPRLHWHGDYALGMNGYGYDFIADPAYPSFAGGYTPSQQLDISAGVLRLKAFKPSAGMAAQLPATVNGVAPWVSTVLTTQDSLYFKPPFYLEVRCKRPSGVGAFPAVWLLSKLTSAATPLGRQSEIDIMESVGNKTKRNATSLHWTETETSNATYFGLGLDRGIEIDTSAGFHTYGALVLPTGVLFYVDGVVTYDVAAPAGMVMDTYFYLILSMAVGGTWAGSQVVGTTPDPLMMEVDYVRLYAPSSNAAIVTRI